MLVLVVTGSAGNYVEKSCAVAVLHFGRAIAFRLKPAAQPGSLAAGTEAAAHEECRSELKNGRGKWDICLMTSYTVQSVNVDTEVVIASGDLCDEMDVLSRSSRFPAAGSLTRWF